MLRTLGSEMQAGPGPWASLPLGPLLSTVSAGSTKQLQAWVLSSLHRLWHEVLLWVLSEVMSPLTHWYFTAEQLLLA